MKVVNKEYLEKQFKGFKEASFVELTMAEYEELEKNGELTDATYFINDAELPGALDAALNANSTNAVQNRAIKKYLDDALEALKVEMIEYIDNTVAEALSNSARITAVEEVVDGLVEAVDILTKEGGAIDELSDRVSELEEKTSPIVISDTPPTDTNVIWIDTSS